MHEDRAGVVRTQRRGGGGGKGLTKRRVTAKTLRTLMLTNLLKVVAASPLKKAEKMDRKASTGWMDVTGKISKKDKKGKRRKTR